jgi:hypothetical protein
MELIHNKECISILNGIIQVFSYLSEKCSQTKHLTPDCIQSISLLSFNYFVLIMDFFVN